MTGPYTGGNTDGGTNTVMPTVDSTAPNHKGPGHFAVLKQDGCNYVSTHYYDTNDNGTAKLQILAMTYDANGWPQVTRNFSSIYSCGGFSDGLYQFQNRNSGKAMAVAGASLSNGALVQQQTFSGTQHQLWYLIIHGDGYYSVINENSLQSLDDWLQSTTPGTNIAQYPYWAGNGQQWSFLSAGSNYYNVRNKLSGYVVDVSGRSTAENAQIIQWSLTKGTNQQWGLVRSK